MTNKLSFNLKSVLFKIALAYLLLIILPFSVGLFILNMAYENQIRRRWQEESNLRLAAIEDDITRIHLDLNGMLVQIRQDETLSPNRIRKNSYHTMMAMLQLRRYTASNSFVHAIAYAEAPTGLVLSNLASDTPGHFTTRTFVMDDQDRYTFWYAVAASNNNIIHEPLLVAPSAAAGHGNILVYTANLRSTRLRESPRLLVLLDAMAVESQLTGALPMESAGLLITNDSGHALFSAGALPGNIVAQFPVSRHVYPLEESAVLRSDYLVSHFVAVNGWHYYMFLPMASLLYEVRGATRIYLFFGLAFAVTSILFFALCCKYNFLPLRRFTQLVRHHSYHTAQTTPPSVSEYELISQGYQALVHSATRMKLQLDESFPVRKNYLFHQLLSGGISESDGLAEARSLSLSLEGKYYTVVLLYAANGEETLPIPSMETFLEAFLQTQMQKNRVGYCIEGVLDGGLTLLFTLPFSEQEAHRLEVVRIQALLTEHFQVHTIACMGGIYARVGDIRLSFQEAARTSRYRNISNKNTCIAFSDTGEDSAFFLSYPTKMIQSFYQALTHESPQAILDRLREISRLSLMDGFTISLYRCIYCDLAFAIFHYFQQQIPTPSANLLDDIIRALETQEMRELQALMLKLENTFAELANPETPEKNLDLSAKLRRYIDEHFHEPSLSIVELADYLGVSTGHLSRSYKKDTGETVLNYINSKRIEAAKHLLADTDIPLQEIVHKIGYLDVSSFHRKFKSMVGITPGAYRSGSR